MSWKDRLQKASFRNISFLYESNEISGGRRVAVHEYPFADESDPEDLGLKAHEFTFNAYFIGDNYDIDAQKFQIALNKKGKAELVLPLSPQIDVQLLTWKRSETTKEGGITRFALKFIQAGKVKQPVRSINVNAALAQSHQQIGGDIKEVVNQELRTWTELRSSAGFEILQQLINIANIFSMLANLINPSTAAVELQNHQHASEVLTHMQSAAGQGLPPVPELFATPVSASDTIDIEEAVNQQMQQQQALFSIIENTIEPPVLLLAAAQLQALEVSVRVVSQPFSSYQQATTVQQQLNTLITRVVEHQQLRTNYDDKMLGSWADLRVKIDNSISQQLLILPKIKHINIDEALPAVVIAHRLYGDAKKATEFSAQNETIHHPGFCVGKLEYLSR